MPHFIKFYLFNISRYFRQFHTICVLFYSILLVNKPDYFEHQELTYLGFNNDFSEVPLIESDCIRFDVNYSDTSRKFADGSSYNGTIQGAKKILKYETTSGTVTRNSSNGYYESSETASGKLSFHQKYLLKIVVEPASSGINWESKSVNLNSLGGGNWYNMGRIGIGRIGGVDNQLLAVNENGYVASSSDGITWIKKGERPLYEATGQVGWYLGVAYGNGIWVAISRSGGLATSSDGVNWTSQANGIAIKNEKSLLFANGIFMTQSDDQYMYTSTNGITWTKRGLCPALWSRVLGYNNGRWIAGQGAMHYSEDNGATWISSEYSLGNIYGGNSGNNKEWYGSCFVNGAHYAVNHTSGHLATSQDGITWTNLGANPSFALHRNIVYGNNKFFSLCQDGAKVLIGTFNSKLKFTNINPSSNGTTSEEYIITEKREFYIEPSQLTTTNLQFNMTNVRLVSAEITNRPYKKITPTCYLEGTTNGIGTAYITTNVKKPLTIKGKALPLEGAVTFYSDNGVRENIGKHVITQPTTFQFSGAKVLNYIGKYLSGNTSSGGINFSGNLLIYKVKMFLNNVKITNSILYNQVIRDYFCAYYGWGGGAPNSLIVNNSGNVWNSIITKLDQHRDPNLDYSNSIDIGYPSDYAQLFFQSGFCPKCYGVGKCTLCFSSSNDGNLYGGSISVFDESSNSFKIVIDNAFQSSGSFYRFFDTSAISALSGDIMLKIVTNDIKGWHCHNFFVINLEKKYLDTFLTENDIIYNKGIGLLQKDDCHWLCFCGDGELDVTVEPSGTNKIIYNRTATNSIEKEIYNSEYETITIDPDNYYYEKLSDGTYRITLNLTNGQISNLQLADTSLFYVYEKLRMPQHSRIVDFSQRSSSDGFIYNVCGTEITGVNNFIMYANNITNSNIGAGIKWNIDAGRWEYYGSNNSHSNYVTPFYYPGDKYWLIEADGNFAVQPYYRRYGRDGIAVPQSYFEAGLVRTFWDFPNTRWTTNIGVNVYTYPWEIYNCYSNKVFGMIGGLTLPINAALYYGADGSTRHKYQWQSNSTSGAWNENDATGACQKVTTSACEKLKQDWGNNLRIYVVKYRKQANYKHPITQATVNFDYSYIDNCASSSSYVYNISTESDLKNTLNTIAEDIKTFAGYTKAKNVE